jgi:hypothetical protein
MKPGRDALAAGLFAFRRATFQQAPVPHGAKGLAISAELPNWCQREDVTVPI